MIQPMRLAGRLETTRAPTRPNPTQVESQIAPSSADSSACVVEMGGFTSLRTAARTIIATPDSHMTHAMANGTAGGTQAPVPHPHAGRDRPHRLGHDIDPAADHRAGIDFIAE